ncbi:MAG TPA: ATP-binding protein [Chloroflexota bacterium]|jgi:signal transduction histidine kinase|nr:ATP-binding protein [Chloroflexota bacterium]
MSGEPLPRVLFLQEKTGALQEIVTALGAGGYEVVAVGRATEALARLRVEDFGVVLADCDLRTDPGRRLLAELRGRWPRTVGLVLSDYASFESAVDVVSEGSCDYLVKPCPPTVLKATIARAMERAALARALREGLEELDEANAQLRTLSEELQRRVDEATGALRRKIVELDRANQKLHQAQEQREELISMIAHDLGGPLTALSGYLQLLDRPTSSPTRRRRARQALAAEVARLKRLVADLADASRLVSGGFRIEAAECDLAALVREQVELARAQAAGRVIRRRVPTRPVPAVCDRHRIAQVLWNLIANAVKYAPTGPIQVGLRVADGGASIAVSDQGPGIPPEQLEAIFEPYVRLPGAGSGGGPKGHGLGLHIARGIVEAHGGRIWAESRAGGGVTFKVWLPLEPASVRGQTGRQLEAVGA